MTVERKAYDAAQAQAEAWWVRLRSGRATRADAEEFCQWCAQSAEHARAWREVKTVWEALEPVVARAVQQDPSVVDPAPAGRAVSLLYQPGRRAFVGGAMVTSAAAFLALRPPMGLWPSAVEFAADYRTGTGEQRQVALGGQAIVQMNTQTRINLNAGEAGKGIELLAGEAEVVTGRYQLLTVHVGGGRLLARDARFNVRHTGPQVCVSCLEGRVEVELAGKRRALERGRQLIYDAAGVYSLADVDTLSVSAWRSGTLTFTDVPLADVIAEINRYRPGKLILRNAEIGRRPVQMRFAIRQTDTALTMIRELYGVTFRELPGGIVLLG